MWSKTIRPLSPSSNSTLTYFSSISESGELGTVATPGYKQRYCWLQYAQSRVPGGHSAVVFGCTSRI